AVSTARAAASAPSLSTSACRTNSAIRLRSIIGKRRDLYRIPCQWGKRRTFVQLSFARDWSTIAPPWGPEVFSMSRWFVWTLLVAALGRDARATEEDLDSATLRRRALAEWYTESPTAWRGRGGPWSQEFRAFMLQAAKRERLRWADQLPGNGRALIEGSTW